MLEAGAYKRLHTSRTPHAGR
eukprot:SAG31_NODE_30638_length_378_cov_0.870968_1_plen_20_part_10